MVSLLCQAVITGGIKGKVKEKEKEGSLNCTYLHVGYSTQYFDSTIFGRELSICRLLKRLQQCSTLTGNMEIATLVIGTNTTCLISPPPSFLRCTGSRMRQQQGARSTARPLRKDSDLYVRPLRCGTVPLLPDEKLSTLSILPLRSVSCLRMYMYIHVVRLITGLRDGTSGCPEGNGMRREKGAFSSPTDQQSGMGPPFLPKKHEVERMIRELADRDETGQEVLLCFWVRVLLLSAL